jgi:hypothetical protein
LQSVQNGYSGLLQQSLNMTIRDNKASYKKLVKTML